MLVEAWLCLLVGLVSTQTPPAGSASRSLETLQFGQNYKTLRERLMDTSRMTWRTLPSDGLPDTGRCPNGLFSAVFGQSAQRRQDQIQQNTQRRLDQVQQNTERRLDQIQQNTERRLDQIQENTARRLDQIQENAVCRVYQTQQNTERLDQIQQIMDQLNQIQQTTRPDRPDQIQNNTDRLDQMQENMDRLDQIWTACECGSGNGSDMEQNTGRLDQIQQNTDRLDQIQQNLDMLGQIQQDIDSLLLTQNITRGELFHAQKSLISLQELLEALRQQAESCRPNPKLGEWCTADSDCQRCSESAMCDNGTCSCLDGFWRRGDTECRPAVEEGGACEFDQDCNVWQQNFTCTNGTCQRRVCDSVTVGHWVSDGTEIVERFVRYRLRGGTSCLNGLVQVAFEDSESWAYVFDFNWTAPDAHVVCRSLGFATGIPRGSPWNISEYWAGAETGVFCCDGTEGSLFSCGQTSTEVSYPESEIAAVTCIHGPKLGESCAADSECRRYTENAVCDDGTCSCPDGLWRRGDTECRPAVAEGGPCEFDQDCNVWQQNFTCTNGTCQWRMCDSVFMEETGLSTPGFAQEYRLRGGTSCDNGLVELKSHTLWVYLFDYNFTVNEARVVCRSLGFSTGVPKPPTWNSSEHRPPIVQGGYNCTGDEPTLMACQDFTYRIAHPDNEMVAVQCLTSPLLGESCSEHSDCSQYTENSVCNDGTCSCPDGFWRRGNTECRQAVEVGGPCEFDQDCNVRLQNFTCTNGTCQWRVCDSTSVKERNADRFIRFRLWGGTSCDNGLVQFQFRGTWVFAIDRDWTAKDAKVACRSVGFGAGAPKPPSWTTTETNLIAKIMGFECSGKEQTLFHCMKVAGYRKTFDYTMAAVTCSGDLTGGDPSWQPAKEVKGIDELVFPTG